MKTCPYCAEEIQDAAIKCRFCGSVLAPEPSGPVWGGAGAEALQYTHSGRRYLLGYGADFFGIWDRGQPASPVSRYPRTDDGWRAAWLAFSAQEPYSSEVGIGGAPSRSASTSATTGRPSAVNAAWWLLPIFMGWLGGLIAWLVNKDVDRDRARAMLITGIVITVLLLVVYAATLPEDVA